MKSVFNEKHNDQTDGKLFLRSNKFPYCVTDK